VEPCAEQPGSSGTSATSETAIFASGILEPGTPLPHGGPTAQTVDTFNPTVAALVSRGYVCIAPNVRGSTGYGLGFQQANHKDLGGGDLQDEVYAARFLTETGYVNAKRIGITGGSYGG